MTHSKRLLVPGNNLLLPVENSIPFMVRTLLVLLFAISLGNTLKSQPLYTPRDIKEAYRKGTRSPDGRPGSHYWQNKGRYDITITAAPPDRTIRGSETI